MDLSWIHYYDAEMKKWKVNESQFTITEVIEDSSNSRKYVNSFLG